MIALLLVAQAAAPALPPPIEAVPVAAAAIATEVRFDAAGGVSGCTTAAHGVAGAIDGCALFGRAEVIARLLGQPTAGLSVATVRLDAVAPGGATPPPEAGVTRRALGAATIDVTPAGAVGACDGAARSAIDLCRLLPTGSTAFAPDGSGGVRRLALSFAIDWSPR